jgi:hypothetical protein
MAQSQVLEANSENSKESRKKKTVATCLAEKQGPLKLAWLITTHGGELLAVSRGNGISVFSQKLQKAMKIHEFDMEWFEHDFGEFSGVSELTLAKYSSQSRKISPMPSSSSSLSSSAFFSPPPGAQSYAQCNVTWTHNGLLLVSSSEFIHIYSKWQQTSSSVLRTIFLFSLFSYFSFFSLLSSPFSFLFFLFFSHFFCRSSDVSVFLRNVTS